MTWDGQQTGGVREKYTLLQRALSDVSLFFPDSTSHGFHQLLLLNKLASTFLPHETLENPPGSNDNMTFFRDDLLC